MRVEPSHASPNTKRPHRILSKAGKFFYLLIRVPFKISLRILFILLIVIVCVIIIRTGVWHVPYASDILYHKPKPLHDIAKSPYSVTMLSINASEALLTETGSDLALRITEGELTSLVEDVNKNDSAISQLSCSITPDYIEFYGVIPRTHPVVVRAHVIPKIVDERLVYDIQTVYVGQVRIPRSLISSEIISRFTPSILTSLQQIVLVDEIRLHEEMLDLVLLKQ